ncbi:alpha/beta hydrolase [Herbidospora mongoliensis]|uniref:alpha/beta hydrolase n=1 Tax=Herbidospora mongoliensis TaxID=688067 RepID=UPI00082F9049|nr:alpha/beta hydrolase [Herbidospora mongoliensis]
MNAVPFDPELAAALTVISENLPPSLTAEMIPLMRQGVAPAEDLTLGGIVTLADVDLGDGVSLLVCRPVAAPTPAPVVYWIHGGGMILGDHRVGLADPLAWAVELGLVVVSVDYRLAPEHPDPTPVEDCYRGLTYVAKNAAELGIDPARIVVAGGSAGGGLAAGTVLLARDRGGPEVIGQVLLCPMLDDRNQTVSSHQMSGRGIWDRTSNETGWTALLGDRRGGPDVSIYASPSRATDLSGLPPAFIDVGSAETFRDEDVAYATAIWQSGGQAELHVWPGGFHGFDMMVPQAALSQRAKQARLDWLRRLLGR